MNPFMAWLGRRQRRRFPHNKRSTQLAADLTTPRVVCSRLTALTVESRRAILISLRMPVAPRAPARGGPALNLRGRDHGVVLPEDPLSPMRLPRVSRQGCDKSWLHTSDRRGSSPAPVRSRASTKSEPGPAGDHRVGRGIPARPSKGCPEVDDRTWSTPDRGGASRARAPFKRHTPGGRAGAAPQRSAAVSAPARQGRPPAWGPRVRVLVALRPVGWRWLLPRPARRWRPLRERPRR